MKTLLFLIPTLVFAQSYRPPTPLDELDQRVGKLEHQASTFSYPYQIVGTLTASRLVVSEYAQFDSRTNFQGQVSMSQPLVLANGLKAHRGGYDTASKILAQDLVTAITADPEALALLKTKILANHDRNLWLMIVSALLLPVFVSIVLIAQAGRQRSRYRTAATSKWENQPSR